MLLITLVAGPLFASEPTQMDLRRLRLSPHGGDLLSIRGTSLQRDRWSAGVGLTYAGDPLHLVTADGREHALVAHHGLLDLSVSRRFGTAVSVAAQLSLVPIAAGDATLAGLPRARSLRLGDPSIALKWRLLGDGDGWGVAVEPLVTLPVASVGAYAGDARATFVPRLIVDYRAGSTTVAVNAGARARPRARLGTYQTGAEVLFGAQLRRDLWGGDAALVAELGYEAPLTALTEPNGRSLEGHIGAAVCVGRVAWLTAAVGGGAFRGLGSTSLRATVNARFGRCGRVVTPAPALLRPPAVGASRVTRRPPEPAPAPPSDRDGDGVVDRKDACPDVPGPPSPVPARNGCPPPVIVASRIVIHQRVHFATDSARIIGKWLPVLDDVAALMRAHPELLLVEVQGHTDDTHTEAYNLRLSQRRAAAVVRHLVSKGVKPSRLVARGYGMTQPVSDNASEAGRAKNRRVVFLVKRRVPKEAR